MTSYKKNKIRYNENINSKVVKVIDMNGKILGVFKLQEAIFKAKEFNMDLVQVSSFTNDIPVCKILNYAKYKYKILKKHKQIKNKKIKVKEIKLRVNTDVNDLNVKLKSIKNAIYQGHRVKVSLTLKGREAIYEDIAKKSFQNFKKSALLFSRVEHDIKKEGRTISILLVQKNE